ncbi:ATP-grasp domain-containing protein [Leclercia adecarboxylata]|uniref:ATP-grasp domain-containing protein n=1 Tax=Leclercia adecarboxylata TaxID=83655 RepID=UPI0011A8CBEE|nr:ATP-grasp domain-containing protein [Leclercia adecarboxylata]
MNNQKTALILDAGFASLPLQQAVKTAGFRTLVCSGKAHDAGMLTADISCEQNYADSEAVLKIAQQHKVAALLPGVTDVSYLSGCRVAHSLGLPGFDAPDVSDTIFLKDKFRAWALSKGLPVPQAAWTDEQARQLKLPLLVKPVDAYSGNGITKVTDWAMLDAAIETARNASPGKQYVVENFCEGALYSHSAFIRNGEIVCEFFVDEYCTVYPWQVNSSSLSQNLSPDMRDSVSECMQSIVSDLRLVDGLLHTQFIASEDQFWLIELTRRCPGDLYSRLIELSTGVNYAGWFVAPFLGKSSPAVPRRPVQTRNIARHTVSVNRAMRFTGFAFKSLPADLIEVIPLTRPGTLVQPAPGDRAGLIFAEFRDDAALRQMTPHLKDYFLLNTYEGHSDA